MFSRLFDQPFLNLGLKRYAALHSAFGWIFLEYFVIDMGMDEFDESNIASEMHRA